jgi:xanthine/uracil permease
MFQWTERSSDVLQGGGVIGPDERLPWTQTGLMGIQHVIAMFGSTVLAPILMGFDPNLAVLMSGIGTLIFFLITGGKVPSYLGSSFAFIGVVNIATGYVASQGLPTPISAWRWAASLPAALSTCWSACWCRWWARPGSSASCRPW